MEGRPENMKTELNKDVIIVPEKSARPQHVRHYFVIALFFVVLITPWVMMELNIVSTVNYENRTLAEKPTVFDPRGYEAYLNDNFAFKNILVAVNGAYKSFFNTSSSNQVVMGKDGWLFYSLPNAPHWDPIATYMGLNRFSDDQLSFLVNKFVRFDQNLKEQGSEFILVIPPNKHTVYSEYLPGLIRKNAKETRMAQLIRCLKDNTDVKVVDLRDAFEKEHKQNQIYYKTDTHWNSYGAYIAYTEIMTALDMRPYSRDEYTISSKVLNARDLARMAGVIGASDIQYEFVLKNGASEPELIEGIFGSEMVGVYTNNDASAPSLMMYHDSYNVALRPFLTPHFSRAIFSWKLFPDAEEVREQGPDYVIFEILERNLEFLFSDECLVVP
jgi:hypothetical protein